MIIQDEQSKKVPHAPYWSMPRIVATFAIIMVISVAGWKILNATFVIDLSGFSFSDFLSLVLAFFSIWLALVFYIKASETSSTFYDNTYKFTSSVSEILGRIEAGFSERLRHMDEGYTRVSDKLDKIPLNFIKMREQIAEEQGVVDEKEKEREAMIAELLSKTKMQDDEKQEYVTRFRIQEAELSRAREEMQFLRRKLHHAENSTPPHLDQDDRINYILIKAAQISREEGSLLDKDAVSRNIMSSLRRYGSSRVERQMVERNILDREERVTDFGMDLIRSLA